MTVRGRHVTPLEADTCDGDFQEAHSTGGTWVTGKVNRGKMEEDGEDDWIQPFMKWCPTWKTLRSFPPGTEKTLILVVFWAPELLYMPLYDYDACEAPLIFQATIFLRLLVTKSWNVLKILDDLKFGNLSSGIPFTYRKTDVVNKTLHLPVVLWLKNGSRVWRYMHVIFMSHESWAEHLNLV